MPLTTQQKNKLRKLANSYTPDGIFNELETLQTQNEQLEKTLEEAQESFKRHIQAIDDILNQLERKKLNTSEFQQFGAEMKNAITGIRLIPGPKGDKPIAGVDYPIPRDADPLVAAEIASRIVKAEIKEEIRKEIPPPVVLDNAEQIRNKLESLTAGNKLNIQAIEDLEDILEELKKRSVGGKIVGGGFSKVAMDLHIIEGEAPSGAVDGANTDFTLANEPYPDISVKIYVNGQRMKGGGEDYTLSGRVITFVTAPPATSIILCDYRT